MKNIESLYIIVIFIIIFSLNIFFTKKDKYWKYFNYILVFGSLYLLIDGYLFYLKDMEYIKNNNIEDKFAGFTLILGMCFIGFTNFIILIINIIKYLKNNKISNTKPKNEI